MKFMRNKLLQKISNEFNPRHDFDNIEFYKFGDASSYAERDILFLKTMKNFLNVIKTFGRGGAVGGTLGIIGSCFFNYPPSRGFTEGFFIGGATDSIQYISRHTYHFIKKQFE